MLRYINSASNEFFCVNFNKTVLAYIDCAKLMTKKEIKKIGLRDDSGLTSVATEICLPLFTNAPSAMNP